MKVRQRDEAASGYPKREKAARVGSNLRGQALHTYHTREHAQWREAQERLARRYRRLASKLFSKRELRRAATIAGEIKCQWREASIKVGPDSRKLDALKASARRKLQRELGRALPGYREARALQRAYLGEQRKLVRASLAGARAARSRLAWGDVEPFNQPQKFVAPFSLFDVELIDFHGFVKTDESFARPEIGHLVNNFVYDQDDSTSIVNGLFGILRIGQAASRASCGTNFMVPAAGRLEIGAVFQNIYNKITYSVHDNFGFSSADVSIRVRLFISLVRGSRVTQLLKTVLSNGLISHGDDLSYTLSDLDDSVPYTMQVVTQPFNANESVQILAGSEVLITSFLDDMHCKMNAVLWWQLKKLTVGIPGQGPVIENPR